MARPSKLTTQIQQRITAAIALGSTYAAAAAYGGVHYDTFHRWMTAGEKARRGAFHEFHEAVKSAEAQASVGWLALIEKAANDGSWQAAAWKLERRYPQEWGRRVLEVKDQAAEAARLRWIASEFEVDPDQAEAEIARLERALRAGDPAAPPR